MAERKEHNQYYKSKNIFGKLLKEEGRRARNKLQNEERKRKKDDFMMIKRNLNIQITKPVELQTVSRRDKLTQWKLKRAEEKAVQVKKEKRPLFLIRGSARIPSLIEMEKQGPSFAPNDYKFKGPTKLPKIEIPQNNRPYTRSQNKREDYKFSPAVNRIKSSSSKEAKMNSKPKIKIVSETKTKVIKPKKRETSVLRKVAKKSTTSTSVGQLIRLPKENNELSVNHISHDVVMEQPRSKPSPAKNETLSSNLASTLLTENIQACVSKTQSSRNIFRSNMSVLNTPVAETASTSYVSPFLTRARGTENTRKQYKNRMSKRSILEDGEPQSKTSPAKNETLSSNLASTLLTENIQPCVSKTQPSRNNFRSNVSVLNTPVAETATTSYVSPFVTRARGKENATKEYKRRMSKGGILDDRDVDVAAAYFRKLLQEQIDIFTEICDKWNHYKECNRLAESAIDMINVAIGQTQLLINQKFVQFSNLIYNFEDQAGDCLTTCIDLHGFWDLLQLQIENINKRFANLQRICDNNWEEILPIKNVIVKMKNVKSKKKVQGSSMLRDAIKAAKAKKADQKEISVATVLTPSGKFREFLKGRVTTSQNRMSTENKKRRFSSPGLHIMKVSVIAKKFANEVDENTPRSILKRTAATSVRKNRSVVFINPTKEFKNKQPNILTY